ncbi:DNA alkylation repair protein [Acanthopleuribacter pedis]|uniref:DNA alkylation repair protein n=1 Tax=Acanthopleuribacter pedis TaxID=442870 RepID=A0A8J7Q102_9BACT|nr:DNA alkylation repair protein [Acanthopleuribacter pedis]MBO1317235.1 DNA alkylation repair protein [Acanthopleuribacter pedis]MBO1318541.1 DNA alkylation repair protein [Acanthopleuribacter pedis]
MTTLETVMAELEAKSNEDALRIYRNQGYEGEAFGVRVGELKKMVKGIKKDQDLVRALFDTGNADAQYLAGLAADPKTFTEQDLDAWADRAFWFWISEYSVAGVAAESGNGWDVALRWIEDDRDHVSAAGWATLTHCLSITPDDQLDFATLETLLTRVGDTIHDCPNRTRYAMNGFVLGAAAFTIPLLEQAKTVAAKIGKVNVDMGKTQCKVHLATTYIAKLEEKNRLGRKKKTARC